MKLSSLALIAAAGSLTILCGAFAGRLGAEPPRSKDAFDALFKQGNFKDAYNGYRALALNPSADQGDVDVSLRQGLQCLAQLGREAESDEFLEAVVAAWKNDGRVLTSVAECYLDGVQHNGSIVAGKFSRGRQRQPGRFVATADRDRVRALQLLLQAMPQMKADRDRNRAGRFFLTLANALAFERIPGAAWRFQSLTSLETLPDYDEQQYFGGWRGGGGGATGAPVDADGKPVYYQVPESFEKAANDGQRWRWALAQAAEANPELVNTVRFTLGQFVLSQFGVQTIAGVEPFQGEDGEAPVTSPYAFETLRDDETMARLATGVKRFTLPDEFNPIKIFQEIVEKPSTGKAEDAVQMLASIFANRRQFVRSAEYWALAKAKYGDPHKTYQNQLDQITGGWGEFGTLATQPAGRGATVDYRFRNGRLVHFEAHRILFDKLLDDVKAYINTRPHQLDWQQLNIDDVGTRLVTLNQQQYLGESVARWDLALDPLSGHFDKRITVSTPLQKAGAYLLTARVEGGNTSRIVVWLDDTVLIRKPMEKQSYYYAADARTGKPIAGADVELFGWRMRNIIGTNKFETDVKTEAYRTDDAGQVFAPIPEPRADERGPFQWLATARTADGRLAHLGFSNVWRIDRQDPLYDQVRVYTITDRPVYRPGAPVRFKFWVARSRYDQPDASDFAGQDFQVEIHNPKGEKVFTKTLRSDAFGGFDGTFELPSDAALGTYQAVVVDRGGGTFRVEEYKKPEFEVKVDAPTKPVMLGEKVKATIKADYYFGGPVTEAKVKYKVTRTNADERWFPVGRWDWLYGSGYWWFAADSSWYPGWSRWGMFRRSPPWWGSRQGPPEVVAQAEVPIRPDGTIEVEIDTALAKASHPNHDHRYEIEAEVVDQSRRTIVGNGKVLVARKPFAVYTWVERGHYRAGDVIEAGVRAQTLDNKPVVGKGTLKLLKVTYEADGKPVETAVESWPLTLDADGQTHQTIKAAQDGQYRLSAEVDDGQGHAIEGGYLLTVTGQGFDGASFRFNDLEIIPEQKEYRAGEKIRLLINANQVDSTVLLFVRPVGGTYLPPRVVRIKGKSTIEEIDVAPRDMPNMFIEALTIAGGKVFDEAREIAVPPESRVVNVEVTPSQATYKPGEKAKIALKLTGPDGKPFAGSTVVTVYDKAVEYISGGSNVPEIRDAFWNWKRTHNPQTASSLDLNFGNLLKPGEIAMQTLGAFGGFPGGGPPWQVGFTFQMPGRRMFGMQAAMAPAPMAAGMGGMGGEMEGARMMAKGDAAEVGEKDKAAAVPNGPQPVVRTNFADTAYWAAAVEARPDGTADVEFPLPDSLTTWKTRAWTLGKGTQVGQAEAEIVTSKDLLVRLQAPRFFVQKDEVVLSAVVHNKLKDAKQVQVILELDGSVLEPMVETSKTVMIAAGSETRVDWRVKVAHEGQAVIRMKALSDVDSDAAQMSFPAYVHGMLKMEAFAGALRPDENEGQVFVRVPEDRRPDQTKLEVRYSPTLAGALVDALPYLADYPYGCTEQTLNRFLPTVITQRAIIDLGVDLKAVRDKHTNLNAQQLGDGRDQARRLKVGDGNPVFDVDEVVKMARAGIQRLADMQLDDGGWGWFSGFGEHSSAHMTALVVHGLQLGRQNDLALPEGMLERGLTWLTTYQAKQVQLLENGVSEVKPYKKNVDDVDAFVFMVLCDAEVRNEKMLGFLDRDRTHLAVYGKCLFGLALERIGERDKLAMVLQNVRQYLVEDDENQTAYLKLPNEGYWWSWHGSDTETDAFYLKLLVRTDPKGRTTSRLVKYVLNNRKHGCYWNSTRDTAFNIEALAEYLKASGENKPDMTVTVAVDGQARKEVRITPADLFSFDGTLTLEGKALDSGEHKISIVKKGTGPLYYNTYLTNFTLEDPITRAGLEIKVDRKVYRLIRDDKTVDAAGGRGQVVGHRVEKYKRELLPEGATLKSGELVEVELEIDSKNDYEYLVFEDYKAAGFEPVEVRSGYNGNDLGAYVEFRDERVAFFVPSLGRGRRSVSYRLRAEIPGAFHALPARAEAMYAPELKGNSDEIKLNIVD
ncbi:alpha-2-macroglobulin family protein [Paludisphaera borealis]|uniref:Putative lipoprotein YfhM n=1 Tax=Paludisphaera borealis TaxID=1387353 RepID=A0A1U7CKG5_9BACT|nr:MG2 domain-containing protein [Paludisphaera borealis]APW59396.1 putative lipoprotein YfhM [Paludisphaera borealis]